MNDDLGSLVSQFVEERVDGPQPEEVDLWSEAVYAALFSVAFEMVIRLSSAKRSPEDLERETNAIIEATCTHAAPWVNARLSEAGRQYKGLGLRVQWDVAPMMRGRMVTYFNEAYSAMADRGYEKEVGRSHACFSILSEAALQLVRGGFPVTPEEAITFVRKACEGCESMSHEVGEAIDSKGR